nr:hypothetical protein [Tanacetum cinerariifolium]
MNTMCDVHFDNNHTPLEAKDHIEIVMNSNDDIYSSDDDSLHEENIEYVEASPHDSELVSLEAAEIVILEVEEIKDDNLREKFSFLEETNTFYNSLPEFETFYFDLGEISSGSTTTHSDMSLPDYEAFYFDDDHIKEISNGSTTTYSDISLSEYDSFIFDLAHIISPPEYDRFYFKDLPDPGELMSVLNFGIHENLSTTLVNLPIEDDYSPLLAYVVWIFVAYLTYPVIPPYLHPFGNKDTIFDPGITINHFYLSKPVLSHRHRAFKKFNTHRSHLNEWLMIINGKNTPLLDLRGDGDCYPGEISSGSTTIHPDISLSEYEAFHDDHVKEISSGSLTTHSDSSLYASFMFDLSIDPFPPADGSDSYEFTDELIPFIFAPEYDCFRFTVEPNSRDFTKDVVENISLTKEPQVLTVLPTHPTLQLNLKFQPSSESLFAYVVWIFLLFLVYSVVPPSLLSLRNEDIIFDPGICKSTSSKPDISHRYETVKKFNTHRSHLNKCPMLIYGQNNPPLDLLLFHF